ncbi:MAG: hypothetical protein JWN10_2329 [Solirubrobacterales bacterium]|nr:hypothetical protein [Solirubrobacterales bacterium]
MTRGRLRRITTDTEMNMGGLFERMVELCRQLEVFRGDLARATLPRRTRLRNASGGPAGVERTNTRRTPRIPHVRQRTEHTKYACLA